MPYIPIFEKARDFSPWYMYKYPRRNYALSLSLILLNWICPYSWWNTKVGKYKKYKKTVWSLIEILWKLPVWFVSIFTNLQSGGKRRWRRRKSYDWFTKGGSSTATWPWAHLVSLSAKQRWCTWSPEKIFPSPTLKVIILNFYIKVTFT